MEARTSYLQYKSTLFRRMRKWSLSTFRKELGTYSCLCGLVVIVGLNEERVISKGTGGCLVSSFATLIETQKKRYLEHDNFLLYEKNPRLQHSPSHSVISSHKAQFMTLCSSLCLYNNLPDRLVFLNTVTLICKFFKPIHSIELLMFKKNKPRLMLVGL